MSRPTCGNVLYRVESAGSGVTDPGITICCNRVERHRGKCDLVMLDMSQKPTRRVLLSNIPRKKREGK